MKRGRELLLVLVAVFSVNIVSALSGSYGSLSIRDFLNELTNFVGPSTIFLGAIFIIAFAILFKGTSLFFKEHTSTAGVVSFVLSFLIIYVINRSGFNFEGIFSYLGYSSGALYTIFSVLVLIGIFYLIYKVGMGKVFMIIGVILISITTFTDWIYEKGISLIAGVFIFLIGFWLWRRRVKKEKNQIRQYAGMYSPQQRRFGGFRNRFQRGREWANRTGRATRERYRKQEEKARRIQEGKAESTRREQNEAKKIRVKKMQEEEKNWVKDKARGTAIADAGWDASMKVGSIAKITAKAGLDKTKKAGRWAGNKVENFAEKDWKKQQERKAKVEKKNDNSNRRKKEKLFRELQGLNKKINNFNKEISGLDESRDLDRLDKIRDKRDKISKRAGKIKLKLKALGYPV